MMGFLKNFVKKYAALLPPIGLLILAILLLLPTMWLGGKVKGEMETSVKQAQTIRSLKSDVPSKDAPAQFKQYMDRLEDEVKRVDALIEQSSQRELIAYNIFPEPTDTSSQVYVEYGKSYQKVIEGLLTAMNALDAPTDAEIRSQTGAGRQPGIGGNVGYAPGGGVQRSASQDPMVSALCIARAEKISVYANPSSFLWYDFWQKFKFEGKDPALQDCWNSQIALWIYDDIVKTIQGINAGSVKVSTSPVKRLLGVSFSGPVQVMGGQTAYYEMGRGQTTAGRDNLNYVSSTLPSNFMTEPWTGRIGGPDYDVIHFAVSIIVDNRFVLGFMRELCSEKEHSFREEFKADGNLVPSRHNQITILRNAVHVVGKDDPAHDLYHYGSGAVMRLDLVCEYLLSRKGYDAIKPQPVKKTLGQDEAAPGNTGGTPAPGLPGSRLPANFM